MSYNTLISTTEAAKHLNDPRWAIVDCRFELTDPDWGEAEYRSAHIPNAVYAHLERDLSGPTSASSHRGAARQAGGRHPLPNIEHMEATFSAWGIGPSVQVVAYDQGSGAYAARLWWMLHYLGHTAAAVLDGGFKQWRQAGLPTQSGVETRRPTQFTANPKPHMGITAAEVERIYQDRNYRLVDARAPERYLGHTEPLDRIGGHIPGALNRFFQQNLCKDGTFRAPEELRATFAALLEETPIENVVSYCGSGVTACHNLLAMQHAGLEGARLYVGSWSEWCADPSRPIATEESAAA